MTLKINVPLHLSFVIITLLSLSDQCLELEKKRRNIALTVSDLYGHAYS